MKPAFVILKSTEPNHWIGATESGACLEAELLPYTEKAVVNGVEIAPPERHEPDIARSPLRLRDAARRCEITLENESYTDPDGVPVLLWTAATSRGLLGVGRPADLPVGSLLFFRLAQNGTPSDWDENDARLAALEEDAAELERLAVQGIEDGLTGDKSPNVLALDMIEARARAFAIFSSNEAERLARLREQIITEGKSCS